MWHPQSKCSLIALAEDILAAEHTATDDDDNIEQPLRPKCEQVNNQELHFTLFQLIRRISDAKSIHN